MRHQMRFGVVRQFRGRSRLSGLLAWLCSGLMPGGLADDLPVALAPVAAGSAGVGQILGLSDLPDRLLFVAPNGIIRYADVAEIWYTADAQSSPNVLLGIGPGNRCCSRGQRL